MKKHMKEAFLLICFPLLFLAPLHAQMKLGLKAGGNLSYSRVPNFEAAQEEAEIRYGWQAGVSWIGPLGERLELSADLLYAQKGGGWRFDGGTGGFAEDYQYLCLPMAANVILGKRFSVNGGLELAYLLDRAPGLIELNRLDLGLLAGMSYRVNPDTYLNLRYVFGLVGPLEFTPTDINGSPYRRFRNDLRTLQLSFIRYFEI